jgi:CRP-like cAMP-binding protein
MKSLLAKIDVEAGGRHTIVEEPSSRRIDSAAVLRFLASAERPVSRREIAEVLDEWATARRWSRLLTRLREDGLIVVHGRGSGQRYALQR